MAGCWLVPSNRMQLHCSQSHRPFPNIHSRRSDQPHHSLCQYLLTQSAQLRTWIDHAVCDTLGVHELRAQPFRRSNVILCRLQVCSRSPTCNKWNWGLCTFTIMSSPSDRDAGGGVAAGGWPHQRPGLSQHIAHVQTKEDIYSRFPGVCHNIYHRYHLPCIMSLTWDDVSII